MLQDIVVILVLFCTLACATIPENRYSEIVEWKAKGIYIEEKNPTKAALYNCVLGLGDFYNEQTGFGIVNLLTWPISILWAPIGGYNGALAFNWEKTKATFENQAASQPKDGNGLSDSKVLIHEVPPIEIY